MLKMIFFLLVWSVVPLLAGMMCNEAKPKKGIILGATLPYSARVDARVLDITRRFKRAQWLWVLIETAAWVPLHFLTGEGVAIGVMCVMFIPMIIVPYAIYIRANKKLRELKKSEDWSTPYTGGVVIDLKAAAEPPKPVKRALFVPPILISLVPGILALTTDVGKGERIGGVIFSVTFALVCILCMLLYPLIYRQRADVAGDDSDLNAALTRVRRYNWFKMLLGTTYMTAVFGLAYWFVRDSDLWTMVLSFAFMTALIAFCMATEFAVRHTMERLTAGVRGDVVDEDDLWLWGMFYNNPGDRHLFINDRTGSGMGVNIGRTGGKLIVIGTALILVGLAVFGVTMAAGFDAPREGYIEGDTLYFQHFSEKYEIDLDDVESVELLDELPEARRIAGTGMSTLLEGRFTVEGYENVRISLNPQSPPFIAVVTGDMSRIFSLETPEETRAFYEEILEAVE